MYFDSALIDRVSQDLHPHSNLLSETEVKMVLMVLNPHGIDPTFLKLDSWPLGCRFYSYYNLKSIKLDKERDNLMNKISFKNVFNSVLGSIAPLPLKIKQILQ